MWNPNDDSISQANISRFISVIESQRSLKFEGYSDFYQWSVDNIAEFWRSCLDQAGFIYDGDPSTAFKTSTVQIQDEYPVPRPDWFPDVQINYAENLLIKSGDETAIISVCENRDKTTLSWDELHKEVAAFASLLIESGVRKGDRVAGFVLNTHETIIAMLAATSMGAIWTSCSPDFGFEGVKDRFGQVEPTVFIAVNGYYYGGKKFDTTSRITKLTESIGSIKKTVIINITGDDLPDGDKYSSWSSISQEYQTTEKIKFSRLPFDHPLYIMYSSGTTGKPKCIVHGAGGTLLQHWKEHHLHTNVSDGTKVTYFTTCGWMMWNWLVGALTCRATLFLFDGSPAFPSMERLWREIDENEVEVFGTSPKFLSASEKSGILPKDKFDFAELKTILSTGSPLTDVNFDYVYSSVKDNVVLSSISGGTDIISCFMLGNPILPVRKGEIQCRGLGMAVAAYDDSGKPVVGEKGELVCTEPFPSMPVSFWDDPGNKRYHSAYFDVYDGIWRHGDFIEITVNGGLVVYGRSDATLNPGGIRIGTAEIYRIVEAMDEIKDSICVGLPDGEGDVDVVLFVVLQYGHALDAGLVKKIRTEIRKGATPRHVPARIHEVDQIPVTISGKKVEIAVANRLKGRANNNLSALANPQALEGFDKYIGESK